MATLKKDSNSEAKLHCLLQRIVHLKKCVEESAITENELILIGKLTTADMAERVANLEKQINVPGDATDAAIRKLSNILQEAETGFYIIDPTSRENIGNALWMFEEKHGDYLSLLPLCVFDNKRTTNIHLNDFATFFQVFIKQIQVAKRQENDTDEYTLSIDVPEAQHTWLHWKETRPIRLSPDLEDNDVGLMEKFLSNKLGPREWLTDKDIERGLKIFGIAEHVHVVPFNADDIGLALHFERQKHLDDHPQKPYAVALILNRGDKSGHNRLDSRGTHWVRMLVTVDPEKQTVSTSYHDSLLLSDQSKADIQDEIQKAVTYQDKIGTGAEAKRYQAFLDPYTVTPAVVVGSGKQVDGNSCGYWALQGAVNDLIDAGALPPLDPQHPVSYATLIGCDAAPALCDEMYAKLLGEHVLTEKEFEQLGKIHTYHNALAAFEKNEKDEYQIKPAVIKGMLFSYRTPGGKKVDKTPDALKKLADLSDRVDMFSRHVLIENIRNANQDNSELKVLDHLNEFKVEYISNQDIEALIRAIFKAIRVNAKQWKVDFKGIDVSRFIPIIQEELDTTPKAEVISDNAELTAYSQALRARNQLFMTYYPDAAAQNVLNTWDNVFTAMVFDLSDERRDTLEMSDDIRNVGVAKLFEFLTEKENECGEAFSYTSFRIKTIDELQLLSAHLQSDSPYLPFKKFILAFPLNQKGYDEIKLLLPLLQEIAVETIEIQIDQASSFTSAQGDELIKLIDENKLTTSLVITPPQPELTPKLKALANKVAGYRREQGLLERQKQFDELGVLATNENQKPITLGKIGRAMFGHDTVSLETEIQVEQQVEQQQQQQQQIQTSADDRDVPDEDDIKQESFYFYSGKDEELIDRANIDQILGKFIKSRYPTMQPVDCFDLIVGKNAEHFSQAICSMTLSAAKQVIEHLSDFQYGLNPDNLSKGFYLEQDKKGKRVLCYHPFSPRLHAQESPLTVKFSKPMPGADWSGDMHQFMSPDQANKLYKELCKDNKSFKKLPLQDCVDHFFFLKDLGNKNITPKHRLAILNAMITGLDPNNCEVIKKKLLDVFGDKISANNIVAISEILYAEGSNGLKKLLTKLSELKAKKGEYFPSFKQCFIDSSNNLRELLSKPSLDAMERMMTFSPAQWAWWESLTEQHTSDLGLVALNQPTDFEVTQKPGQRFAQLAELVDGFSFFCQELDEIQPGLKNQLTPSCPLEGVADMRVGLDRLLTIMRNAHDKNEQFQALKGVSLDALGPFYASRYEGYKLVTAEMILSLGNLLKSHSKDPQGPITAELSFGEKGTCYRVDKINLGGNIGSTDRLEEKCAYYLRYMATFNHRASFNLYKQAFDLILSSKFSDEKNCLLMLIDIYGTGKRGKYFNVNEVKSLIEIVGNFRTKDDDFFANYLNHINLFRVHKPPATPTIAEIITIARLFFEQDNANLYRLLGNFDDIFNNNQTHADLFFTTLATLSKNKRGIPFALYMPALSEIQRIVDKQQKIVDKQKNTDSVKNSLYFQDIDKGDLIRAKLANVLAILKGDGVDQNKINELYLTFRDFYNTHGSVLTHDLIDIICCIDTEQSKELPSIDELTKIVSALTTKQNVNFNQILDCIRQQLPDCQIVTAEIQAAPLAATSDLSSTISRHMATILKELEQYKAFISPTLYKRLENEGATGLLNLLGQVKTLPLLILNTIELTIKKAMIAVYKEVMTEYLARINTPVLIVMMKRIPLFSENNPDDFGEFCDQYADQLDKLEKWFIGLERIQKKWPKQFADVINILNHNDSCINEYDLQTLATILTTFVEHTSERESFPTETFSLFFKLGQANINQQALCSILETVFIDVKSQGVILSADEQRKLCQLGVAYIQQSFPKPVTRFLSDVVAMKKTHPGLLGPILDLLLAATPNDIQDKLNQIHAFHVSLNEIKDSALQIDILRHCSKHPDDFSEFIGTIDSIRNIDNRNSSDIEKILGIALRGVTLLEDKNYNWNRLKNVMSWLGKVDQSILDRLVKLYAMLPYPSLDRLYTLLKKTRRKDHSNLCSKLEAEYDRDPYGHRSKGAVDELFKTEEKAAELIDAMRDLNYDRPLLYSQKKQLYKWFLYLNAIGQDQCIHTHPDHPGDGEFKSIELLSHAEIQRLIKYYREFIKRTDISEDQRIKAKLEYIAIARTVMCRTNSNKDEAKLPSPTQILYLLSSMQNGNKFIGEMPTGQGKTMTAALMASLKSLEGKTVDICTNELFLADEGFRENQRFFEYMGIPVAFIKKDSKADDYVEGGVHYSSMAEMALYRSDMELRGKHFPPKEESCIIAEEVDFSTLDNTTQFRHAMNLDPVADPYQSSYQWAYEALVDFTDANIKANIQLEDKDYIAAAQKHLAQHASGDKHSLAMFKQLTSDSANYEKRLQKWLYAAVVTAKIDQMEEKEFRVMQLKQKRYGVDIPVSKACKLINGRPDVAAEYSDMQQFFHVRLNKKYAKEINEKTMGEFLVEPERTYVTTLNSKILLNRYADLYGMSGTVGSSEEIKEQYGKYGVRCIEIPPYQTLTRDDKNPILTHPKFVSSPEQEAQDHINKIINDIVNHIERQGVGVACSPVLVTCKDKEEGERIRAALQIVLNKPKYKNNQQIQAYYGGEPTDDERTVKERAGTDGMITISTVFTRGTDIKPTHEKGLYVIQTYVDDPRSAEDLERKRKQIIGRAGRQGKFGQSRLIIKRSEFKDIYSKNELKKLPSTKAAINDAINALNNFRNKTRIPERAMREMVADVREEVYKKFFKYMQAINRSNLKKSFQKELEKQLLLHWKDLLTEIDEKWSQLSHDPKFKGNLHDCLNEIAQFACEKWKALTPILNQTTTTWLTRYKSKEEVSLPTTMESELRPEDVITTVEFRHPQLKRRYIKAQERRRKLDTTALTADTVYCEFFALNSPAVQDQSLDHVIERKQAAYRKLQKAYDYMQTPAHQNKLSHLKPHENDVKDENIHKLYKSAREHLYLRYKAYRSGNLIAYAELNRHYRELVGWVKWSKDGGYLNALSRAEADHYQQLMQHRGEYENRKAVYLQTFMADSLAHSKDQTNDWKETQQQATWLTIKADAVKWLQHYRDGWSRTWVSSDRIAMADSLLVQIKNHDNFDPASILKILNQMRATLLEEDIKKGRSMHAGLDGRFNGFLNDMRTRVLMTCTSVQLDTLAVEEFNDIKQVLQSFLNRQGCKNLPEYLSMKGILDTLTKDTMDIPAQYNHLLTLFAKVEALALKEENLHNNTLKSLYQYCRLKREHIVLYFAQCDKHANITQDKSVEVFRAANQAATTLMADLVARQPAFHEGDAVSEQKFSYLDDEIAFADKSGAGTNRYFTTNLFFNLVNKPSTYRLLLWNIEKAIVEQRSETTEVQFTQLTLDMDAKRNDKFILEIKFKINDKETSLHLHFDMNRKTVYCDEVPKLGASLNAAVNTSASKENSRKIDLGPVPVSQIDKFERKVGVLESETDKLTRETDKKLSIDDAIILLRKNYDNSEEKGKKTFVEFVTALDQAETEKLKHEGSEILTRKITIK